MQYSIYFSILFFSVCVIFLVAGVIVLQNNRKSPTNICFFALITAIIIWSSGLGLATSAPDVASGENWRRFAAIGWGSAYAIMLHFFLLITGNDRVINRWWKYLLLYLPAAITVTAFGAAPELFNCPYQLISTEFGWVNISGRTFWDWFFYLYYISYFIIGLVLVVRWGRKSNKREIKKQSATIFLSFTIALILATFTDVFLNRMSAKLPQMAPIIMLIPIISLFHIIHKYGFINTKPLDKKVRYVIITLCVVFYIFLFLLVSGEMDFMNGRFKVGISARGVFTQLQLLISVYLVLLEDWPGFIAAAVLNANCLIFALTNTLINRTYDSVPGIYSYVAAILVIVLIASFKKKTAASIEKIDSQRRSLEESENKLYKMAYYDSLTGLPNKKTFTEHLNRVICTARRNASMIGVAFIDMDTFKSVNDTMGHNTGDVLLEQIALRLSNCLRGDDMVARFGGDEFLMEIANINRIEDLQNIINRVKESFKQPFVIQDIEYFISVSIGVSIYPIDGEEPESLIKNADMAMYAAKSKGKNQYAFCTAQLKDDIIKQLKLTNSIYRALEKNEFYINYQPLVRAKTQEIIGFEALLRWKNEEFGLISPEIFIPIAEQTGLIRQIGLWVFESACKKYKLIRECISKDFFISVNISLEQLKDAGIVSKIRDILISNDMDTKSIQIEITESIALDEDPSVIKQLREIKNLGITISIDDFGKGYSSFNRLKSCPIDILKIDMDFVHGITGKSQKDKAIIKSIIQIAKNLKMEVLAEGVETEEEYLYLKNRGCDYIQGYYFYKPMQLNDIIKVLEV